MIFIFVLLGFSINAFALFNISKIKRKLSDSAILEYEKQIRPAFIKYYYLAIIPLIIYVTLLLTGTTEVLNYIWLIAIITFILDTFTIYKLKAKLSVAENSNTLMDLLKFFIAFVYSKYFLLLALYIYIISA
ncbi:MAG TPA: hypothetical protein VN698_07055 [Bacteroidia bacterium]|nr:hypothetical protein [Bacteroidia bacterium]